MSLYIHIAINDKVIQSFGAQNISRNIPVDEESVYRVCKYVNNGDGLSFAEYLPGNVYHRREEGAVILSKKVLDYVISLGEL